MTDGELETKLKKLNETIEYENAMLENCMAHPTETPQFYNAMEATRERIKDLYDARVSLQHLIKQNTLSKESVSPPSQHTSKADDSSIPDDAGELREDWLDDFFKNIANYYNQVYNGILPKEDVPHKSKHLIHQQRQRWEKEARQTAVNEAMDWISKNNSKFQKHLDKIALRELAATLAAAEKKEDV
jgi:hypothetical protein